MMVAMVPVTRLFADGDGHARFEDIEIISGRVEVTASGETRTFGPGDVLLVEDTEGLGHSSRSAEGFLAAFVVLKG
jgi:hypothetical protein